MTEPRPVLLMSGNHTTQSLWRPLSEHFDICLTHAQMAGMMTDMGVSTGFPLAKYMSADVQEHAINLAYHIAANVLTDENSARLEKVVAEAFSGEKLPSNFANPYLHEWWVGFVGEHIRNEMVVVDLVEKLVQDRKVVGCVVHEDVTPDMRTLVRTCQHYGIPTIHIPHANCFYVGDGWDIHTESISDHLLAAGSYMRDWYTHWGYPEEKIRITGMPQWDSVLSSNRPTRSEARRVLGIQTDGDSPDGVGEFVLVYATTWGQLTSAKLGASEEEIHTNLRRIAEATRELNATLLIKMHPGETQGNEQGYQRFLAENKLNGLVMRGYNEYVLSAADCLVAHAPSNLCCQAAFVGLPSAYIPVEDYAFPEPGPIAAGENITWAVKMAMSVRNTWEPFSKMVNDAYPEGNAGERITQAVVEICG